MRNLALTRRILDSVHESRLQQDNEPWHLLILEGLKGKKGIRDGFLRYWLIPQMLAFVHYLPHFLAPLRDLAQVLHAECSL